MQQFIIVGLGNVGEKYHATRHNIGFEVVDRLAAEYGLAFHPAAGDYYLATNLDHGPAHPVKPWWRRIFEPSALPIESKRHGGITPPASGEPIALIKPTTFMNLSGRAVRQAKVRFNVSPAQVVVVCDDFNLPVGSVRLRKSGSDGGHNGLKSVTAELDTEEYPRLRLGIGPRPSGVDMAEFALSQFQHNELAAREEGLKQAVLACKLLISSKLPDAIDIAASKYNISRLDPAPGSGPAAQ